MYLKTFIYFQVYIQIRERHPGKTFGPEGATWPSVVLEVGYSES